VSGCGGVYCYKKVSFSVFGLVVFVFKFAIGFALLFVTVSVD
jgi:hypothetical protein